MIKLLIVDDEQIEREGMRAILQKAFPNISLKLAYNGRNAVEITKEFSPDLILMDIKMPGMNGLETIEKIKVTHPSSKFIMVTAYDMFEYIRTAIKLGAKDYILKPSKASDIIQTVGRLLNEIEEEKKLIADTRNRQEAYERALTLVETDVVTQLLFDHVHEVHVDMLVEMLQIKSTSELFVISLVIPLGSENLYSSIKEQVRQSESCWVGAFYGNQLPIIVFRDPDKSFRSQAVLLARKILSIRGKKQDGWFVGIGSVVSSLNQVKQSYHHSLIASIDTTLSVKYRFYEDVPVLDDVSYAQLNSYLNQEFTDEIRHGKWEDIYKRTVSLIQFYEKKGAGIIQAQQKVLESIWVITRVMNEIGIHTMTPLYSFQANNYRQLHVEVTMILDKLKQLYLEHFNHFEADAMKQIKQYIVEHSHEDISLESLGKKVGLSPIYISKMFKEKLGINYIDFLTECRIEKAKKLLYDPEKSIKEITFEVGYHEPNYFSKVFKKICKISPKEYRKSLLTVNGQRRGSDVSKI